MIDRQRHHAADPEVAGAGRDAGPGGHHRGHRRRRGVDLQRPGRIADRTSEAGRRPRPVLDGRRVQVDRGHRQVGGVLAGRHRVAEGQRIGAGSAGIGRRAAVVERQRRRAAGNRHRLVHIDGQRHNGANPDVAGARRNAGAGSHHRGHRRRRGVDLQRAGRVGDRPGEAGCGPCPVCDSRRIQVDRAHRQVGGVLARRHRVAEGQGIGAGPTGIGRRAAVVERQRRRAAGNRHRLAHIDRQRHHAARGEVAGAGRDPGAGGHHRGHRRRRGIDLQRAGRVGDRTAEAGGCARPVRHRRRVQVDRGHRQVGGVLTGRHRVAEGQGIGAGPARIGRRAAVIERQRRRATGHRHRLAHVDGQRHHAAHGKVARAGGNAGTRGHHRGYRRRRAVDLQRASRVGDRTSEAGRGPSSVLDGRRVQVDRGHRQVGGVLACRHRVAEGQGIGAGPARIGRRAAVVERQRRRAAGNRHRLAHVDRQRHNGANPDVAGARRNAGARSHHRGHRRRRGVDDDARKGLRQVGGSQRIAGKIRDCPVDSSDGQASRVLTSTDGVAESECARTRAAGIGRGTAVIERQCRRARDGYRFAHVQRQCERLAVVIAARGRRNRGKGRGCCIDRWATLAHSAQ